MKRVKIFSDADEYELEKQINEFLRDHGAKIDNIHSNVVLDAEAGKIITAVLQVDVEKEIQYE